MAYIKKVLALLLLLLSPVVLSSFWAAISTSLPGPNSIFQSVLAGKDKLINITATSGHMAADTIVELRIYDHCQLRLELHALSVLEWPHPLAMLYVEVPPSPKWNPDKDESLLQLRLLDNNTRYDNAFRNKTRQLEADRLEILTYRLNHQHTVLSEAWDPSKASDGCQPYVKVIHNALQDCYMTSMHDLEDWLFWYDVQRPLAVVWPVKNNWDLLRSDPGWCSLYGNRDVKYVFFRLREAVDRVSDVQVRKLVRDKSAKQGWT